MHSIFERRFASLLFIVTAVGCATATVGEDPVVLDPDVATGGTSSSSGGTDTGSGGTSSSSGGTDTNSSSGGTNSSAATSGSGGAGARMNFGGAGRVAGGGQTSSAGRASTTGGRSFGFMGGAGTTATNTFGGAGRTQLMGGAGTGGGIAGCENPRDPAQPGATQGNSGSFDTTEAVCYFVVGTFNAWNCSNIGGRTVTINGSPAMCGGPLPAPVDGGYYFQFSASTMGTNYTTFYWYTS